MENNKRYVLDRESTSIGDVWKVYDCNLDCIVASFYSYVLGCEFVEHLNEVHV